LERIKDHESRLHVGHWALILVTAVFALFYMVWALRGMSIAFGAADPFYDALMAGNIEERQLAESYRNAIPIVGSCFCALGISQFVAAYFLKNWQMRYFVIAWLSGFLIVLLMLGVQLSVTLSTEGLLPQFMALAIQAVSVPLLFKWSRSDLHTSGDLQ
jgi:Na+/melibiose symporter-like transporter